MHSSDEIIEFGCCLCGADLMLDMREFTFPYRDNHIQLGFSGCGTNIKLVHAPEMQVQTDWSTATRRDRRPKNERKNMVPATKFISVRQGKCCCACGMNLETVKLNHGQEIPKTCTIM